MSGEHDNNRRGGGIPKLKQGATLSSRRSVVEMGANSHHTSSLREAMAACLLALGLCTLSLSIGANHLKLDAGAWRAVCDGAPRRETAGNLLAAAAALTLLSMLLGVYHGSRGVWSVMRAVTSGSWSRFRHRLRTKPLLWQLALSFAISLICGCVSADVSIRGARRELVDLSAEDCLPEAVAARSLHSVVGAGVLGLLSSLGSASLFVYTDVKERRKRKQWQYVSSAYYNDDPLQSDDEELDDEMEAAAQDSGATAVHVSSFSVGTGARSTAGDYSD
mmetsp:Transcript_17596/g.44662  ORF Transcript_17596/g.44662 Transcript_17596/m.44662 type:complete len:277 (-) Transcript_17596:164-994(-)